LSVKREAPGSSVGASVTWERSLSSSICRYRPDCIELDLRRARRRRRRETKLLTPYPTAKPVVTDASAIQMISGVIVICERVAGPGRIDEEDAFVHPLVAGKEI